MATPTTYVFEDSLFAAAGKRCLQLPFDVPAGTAEIRVELGWAQPKDGYPPQVNSLLALALYDPEGFRGNAHDGKNPHVVEIGPHAATPGFRSGHLPAGRWTLEVQTHAVLAGVPPLEYRAQIWLTPGKTVPPRAREFAWQGALRPGPGWYRGDLHTHTVHSDGQDTVASLLERSRAGGLDFIALTDHNTIEQIFDPALQGYTDMAVLPGMELTTYFGHALALGVTQWIDWRTTHQRRTMAQTVADVHALGGFTVLAHLASLGDPICTGCAWLYTDQMPGSLRGVEVSNGPSYSMGSNNSVTLRIYYEWLSRGHRLVATSGTDTHDPCDDWHHTPRDVVYAPELSPRAILAGIAAGHVMLSTGPEVYLEAALADGRTAIMGDAVATAEVRGLTVWTPKAPAGSRVQWIVDGEPAATWEARLGTATPALPAGARWALAELRAADGSMLAMTNPLYLDRTE